MAQRTTIMLLREIVSICWSSVLVLAALAAAPFLSVSAQAPVEEKPALKEFGSSLKRLKWDPEKQAAIDVGRSEKPSLVPVEDVIRIDTELVVSDVLVVDKEGHAVQGLTQKDFVIAEDGQPQQISHFSAGSEDDAERSIVLVFDYSSSQLPYINNTAEAAKILVDHLNPRDQMAIVTDDVELKVDFTRDKVRLKYALEDLRQRATLQERFGRSDQFSALMATVRELFSKEDVRRIVIFQTDGDELYLLQPPDLFKYALMKPPPPGSSDRERRKAEERLAMQLVQMNPQRTVKQFSLNDIVTAAEKSRATIYSIIPGWRFIGLSPQALLENVRNFMDTSVPGKRGAPSSRRYSDKQILAAGEEWGKYQLAVSSVATKSGGFTSFLENPNQANEIYSRILSDVNSRYVIGYYPTNKLHDGKRRKVSIQIRNHPEYTIEGRRSYFAPGPEEK
jgi:VWFA-related protein